MPDLLGQFCATRAPFTTLTGRWCRAATSSTLGPSARSRKDRDEEWRDEDAEDEEDFASEEAFFGSVWATALPATLTQLSLHFIYCDVGDGGDQALASSLGFRCCVLCVFCVLGVCSTCCAPAAWRSRPRARCPCGSSPRARRRQAYNGHPAHNGPYCF